MFRLLTLLVAITIVHTSDVFNDSLARNTLLPLAATAYGGDSNKQQQCLDKHMPGAKLSLRAEVLCDEFNKGDMCSAYTVYDTWRGYIALVFRGTVGDVELDVEVLDTLFEHKVPFRDGGGVVPYFNGAFNNLWDETGLKEDFLRLASIYPHYKLYITGHSLGAALAALGVVHVAKNNLFPAENITYYTFGEPRTGDKEFADMLDSLIPHRHYRVIHARDIIPHCPFTGEQGGRMDYHHHAIEVWYNNDMSAGSVYKICKEQEDPTCSMSNGMDLVMDPDHSHYYGIHAPTYGKSGCTENKG